MPAIEISSHRLWLFRDLNNTCLRPARLIAHRARTASGASLPPANRRPRGARRLVMVCMQLTLQAKCATGWHPGTAQCKQGGCIYQAARQAYTACGKQRVQCTANKPKPGPGKTGVCADTVKRANSVHGGMPCSAERTVQAWQHQGACMGAPQSWQGPSVLMCSMAGQQLAVLAPGWRAA